MSKYLSSLGTTCRRNMTSHVSSILPQPPIPIPIPISTFHHLYANLNYSLTHSIQNPQRTHQNARQRDARRLVHLLRLVLCRAQSPSPRAVQLLLSPLFLRRTHPHRPARPPDDPIPTRERRNPCAADSHSALPSLRVPSTRERLRARLPRLCRLDGYAERGRADS